MSTQVSSAPSIPKGKDKEVDASSHTSDVHTDAEEDTWGQFPLDDPPSPPADGFCHERQANPTPPIDPSIKFSPPLDPPLMALTFPPPPHLANDPKWYSNMLSEVHRHRDHLNNQLERAHSEAVAALAEVTLAQIELSAELDQIQNFINCVASVAGHKFVRKHTSDVHCEDAADDESEGKRQDADEDSSGDLSPQPPSPAPGNPSCKRLREEDEATSSANSSPGKKFRGEQSSPESSPVWPRHYTHPGSDDEDAPAAQHVRCPEDDEIDSEPNSDEEFEVEDSLFLVESEAVTPPLPGSSMPRSLLEISRDPRRLRQNSRGEPELYIPGR